MEILVNEAMERIRDFLRTLPSQAAADVSGAEELARTLVEGLPAEGTPFPELLDLLFDRLLPKTFNTAGPGYLAYIPGGGIPMSAIASLIADSVNRYVGVWLAAPGFAQLEANVGRWFCEIFGYPRGAIGLLTSGGSMSNLIGIVTARRTRLPDNFLSATIYASDQTHSSVAKAAVISGFPQGNVRTIPSDDVFRIDLSKLWETVHEDRNRGLTPFLIAANAGTTNTGAVDSLEDLADMAREEGMWLHVDAAYGGFFMVTEDGRAVLKGIDRADSITVDPHKGLFLPYGTGSLLVRDATTLRRAHSLHADYLPAMRDDDDLIDFCQVSPELSRAFRGLRVWLPLKLYGIGPFRRNLQEKIELARWITNQLKQIDEIEIVAEPQLSLLAFRIKLPGLDEEALNRINRRFLDAINARKRVYLTSTRLGGRFVIRICVLSFRTHMDRMQMALDDIRAALNEVISRDPHA